MKSNFFLFIDFYVNFILSVVWFSNPYKFLDYNFNLKKYDDIHLHLSRMLSIALFGNAILSYYGIMNKLKIVKTYIFNIKIVIGILLIIIMIYDNINSNLMGEKHLFFGILGLFLIIINNYFGLKSLKKESSKKLL